MHESAHGTKQPIRNVRYDVRMRGRGGRRSMATVRPRLTRLRLACV